MQERRTGSRVSKQWIKETRKYFLDFLRATNFPEFAQAGERGPEVEYPEWLIMWIGGGGSQKQGEDVCGDSPAEHTLLARVVWEGGPGRAHLGESLADALKKNLLCPWSRCRIRLSDFSTRLRAIGW
jgi:hypothetical protein